MATRTGTLDPGLLVALMRDENLDAKGVEDLIYRRGGLLGLSGISGDMRTLLESPEPAARQAVEHFCHSAVRHAGSLVAALGGIDGLVFTGGIGEHAARIRAMIVKGLSWLGLDCDRQRNRRDLPEISSPGARAPVYVVPANEELAIARHTLKLLEV